MIDKNDFIEKMYFHNIEKRNKIHKRFRYICDKCGNLMGYYHIAKFKKDCLCQSCRAKGKIISKNNKYNEEIYVICNT